MDNFDLIKARIAQSLLPIGYTIVKGVKSTIHFDEDESDESVKGNTDSIDFTKAEVMERMDDVEDQMNAIEELHKEGVANKRHDNEYIHLNKMYNILHNKYKTM